MIQTSELIYKLTRHIESKRVNTFFVNGSPGSGKSSLLNRLSLDLPASIGRAQVFGPYQVSTIVDLNTLLVGDLRDSAYIEGQPQPDVLLDITSTWNWLKYNLQASARHTLVILVDLDYETIIDQETWRSWLSSIRYLEHNWDNGPARLLVLVCGYWQHTSLEDYYRGSDLSFPYTVGQNYLVWEGISPDQMVELVKSHYPETDLTRLFGNLIHETTGGHAGAAQDILHKLGRSTLSVPNMVAATKLAARDGPTANKLTAVWAALPKNARQAIEELLLFRQIPATLASPYLDNLHTAGVVKLKNIAGVPYVGLSSWYVDLVARNHVDEIGISGRVLSLVDPEELIPGIQEFNMEAYRLINSIENLARNFVATHLCSDRGYVQEHFLEGKVLRKNQNSNYEEDAYERAQDWKARNQKRSTNVDINPLIAYMSTRDLSCLLKELGEQLEAPLWQHIADVIDGLSGLRDTVMHNQLIDEISLQNLYDLQAEIYQALNYRKDN